MNCTGKNRRIAEDIEDKIIELWRNNIMLKIIERAYDVSRKTVYAILRRRGIETGRPCRLVQLDLFQQAPRKRKRRSKYA